MKSVVPTKAFPQVVPPRFGPGGLTVAEEMKGRGIGERVEWGSVRVR